MSKKIKKLDLEAVRYVSFKFAREHLEWGERIPPFNTADLNILESCLETPFQSFRGEDLYKGIVEKSAALFYFLIKNHPFQNGNKRLAITITWAFLIENGKWLKIPTEALYELSKEVAKSKSENKNKILELIKDNFKKYMVDSDKIIKS